MRVFFDYPLATEENLKAVQDAINSGKSAGDLIDMFGEEVVWDCYVILSGNKDTTWALLDGMDGDHQSGDLEEWQNESIESYVEDCQSCV
jgi:hypothetical protein